MKRPVRYGTVYNNSESRRKEHLSPGTENVELNFKRQDVLHSLNIFFLHCCIYFIMTHFVYTQILYKEMLLFFLLKESFLSQFLKEKWRWKTEKNKIICQPTGSPGAGWCRSTQCTFYFAAIAKVFTSAGICSEIPLVSNESIPLLRPLSEESWRRWRDQEVGTLTSPKCSSFP